MDGVVCSDLSLSPLGAYVSVSDLPWPGESPTVFEGAPLPANAELWRCVVEPATNATAGGNSTVNLFFPSNALAVSFKVWRSDICPEAGMYGLGAGCRACPTGGICPGGYAIFPATGWWAPSNQSTAMIACSPREACAGGPGSPCSAGYVGAICSICAPGYFRARRGAMCFAGESSRDPRLDKVNPPFLVALLVALGSVFYRMRTQTAYFFPYALWLWRLTQAVAVVALYSPRDPRYPDEEVSLLSRCANTAQRGINEAFAVSGVFPACSGLLEFYTRFWQQYAFTNSLAALFASLWYIMLFLCPLLCTPAWVWWKIRRARSKNMRPDAEPPPQVLLLRAIVTWGWLMSLPLLFVTARTFVCIDGAMAAFPSVSCDGSSVYSSTVVLAVMGFATTVLGVGYVIHQTVQLARAPDAPIDLYLRFSFLYGHCRAGAMTIHAWLLDAAVMTIVLVQACFLRHLPTYSAALWAGVLLPCAGLTWVLVITLVKRPFVGRAANAGYATGLFCIMLLIGLQQVSRCRLGVSRAAQQMLAIASAITYLLTVVFVLWAAVSSRKRRGWTRYHGTYTETIEDGTDDDEHSAQGREQRRPQSAPQFEIGDLTSSEQTARGIDLSDSSSSLEGNKNKIQNPHKRPPPGDGPPVLLKN